MIKKIFLFGAVFLIIGALWGTQKANALTLIPPTLEFGVQPDSTVDTSIKLFNETADDSELYTEVKTFTAKDETGVPDFDFTDSQAFGLEEWVKVESGPITIEAGQRKEIPVSIKVPGNAEPGGHYVAVFFSTAPLAQAKESQVKISSKLGTLVFIRVEGDINEQGSIIDFLTGENRSFFSHLPIEFSARFENTGNVHVRPTGEIIITNMFGSENATLDFNSTKGATLPKSVRKYDAIWEKSQTEETIGGVITKFRNSFLNEWNNFAFGKYKATLQTEYGIANNHQANAEISFWVIPWRVISVIIIPFIIILVLFIFGLKRYNRWVIQRAGDKKDPKVKNKKNQKDQGNT